jgi:ABC-type Fe3+ transport system permease subunit
MAFTRTIEHRNFDSRRVPRKIFFSLKFIPVLIIVLAVALIIVTNTVNKSDFTGSTVNNEAIDAQVNQDTQQSKGSSSFFLSPLFYFVSVFVVLIVVMFLVLGENRRRKKVSAQMEYLGGMDLDI